MSYGGYDWKPYVPVAQRRAAAAREVEKKVKGRSAAPVVIEGRTIAETFWGQAWCRNLERYSDYSNRLPRGRTYVRNGSVVDLELGPGAVAALVSGSRLYTVSIEIKAVAAPRWKKLAEDCAGAIDSLVELLQGRFSKAVMERLCRPGEGLFPTPAEIHFSCSCPDWAAMCKHVAAVLYGIGARLDQEPELLFRLRQVDERALLAGAGRGLTLPKAGPANARILASDDLGALFGLELGGEVESPAKVESAPPPKRGRGQSETRPARARETGAKPRKARRPATTRRRPKKRRK